MGIQIADRLPCLIEPCDSLESPDYDGIVLVTSSLTLLGGKLLIFRKPLEELSEIDNNFLKAGGFLPVPLPAKRLAFAPTGPLNRDYDDVRRYGDAARKGIQRILSAGSKSPLLVVVVPAEGFQQATLVAILGALEETYVPIQLREDVPTRAKKVSKLGVWGSNIENVKQTVKLAKALESGRFVARDIGGGDPERMAPIRVEEYVRETFEGTDVKLEVISDAETLRKEYPLFAAVDRAAQSVERHRGRIIYLTYEGEGPITDTVCLVGKGVTYDTGGADIKAGGVMAGMSRDKCGSAAVAGFFQVLSALKPKGIKVIGGMAMVRNSVGEECYVADEMITSRAGARIRVGNTDAEGRMAMGDVLCRMKELAVGSVNPYIFTIATLTGHACLAVGDGYTIIMENGPAKRANSAREIQNAGESVGDMVEVSTIRREDYEFHSGKVESEDLLQCNNLPSSRTARGHQAPAAFMIMAAGLDKHGNDSHKPLKYSHVDIAASSGDVPHNPTGAPILALATHFLTGKY